MTDHGDGGGGHGNGDKTTGQLRDIFGTSPQTAPEAPERRQRPRMKDSTPRPQNRPREAGRPSRDDLKRQARPTRPAAPRISAPK